MNSMLNFEVLDRVYNAQKYEAFLSGLFATFHNMGITGAILIMDNVPFHRSLRIRELVRSFGHTLFYLPPYSPFLNSIENVFNQWKNAVQTAKPTNEHKLLAAIEDAARLISPTQCRNYFSHMESYIPRCMRGEIIGSVYT